MNASQEEDMSNVIELLGEQFDYAIVAAGWCDDEKCNSTASSYSGEVSHAIGLCRLNKTKW